MGKMMTAWRKSPRISFAWPEGMPAVRRIFHRCPVLGVLAVALLLTTASTAFAAGSAGDATPDFSGTWERYPDPWEPGPFPMDPPPPGGGPKLKEPYASEFRKLQELKAEAYKEGKPLVEPSTQCVPEGMPTIMAAVHPIEILQTPEQVLVLAEFLTQTRRIYLNEEMPDPEEIFPGYNGYSVGRWEGDTLVVETIGIREDVKFHGIPRTENMKITERIRLTGPDLIESQIVIEDPEVLVSPYEFTFGYKRNPDYRIMEYICDNNRHADGDVRLDATPE